MRVLYNESFRRLRAIQAGTGFQQARSSFVTLLTTQGLVILITLPTSVLLARSLGPAALGIFLFAQRVSGLSSTALHLSVAHGFSFYAADARENVRTLKVLSLKAVLFLTPGIVLLVVGIAAFQGQPAAVVTAMMVAFIPALLQSQFASAILRGQLQSKSFGLISLAQPVAWATCVGLLALLNSTNLYAACLLYIASHFLAAAFARRILNSFSRTTEFSARQDDACTPRLGQIVRYGLRAHFGQAGREMNIYLDQVLLGFLLPFAVLGSYAVAASSALAVAAVNAAIVPLIQPLVQKSAHVTVTAIVLPAAAAGVMGVFVAALTIPMPWLVVTLYGTQYYQAGFAAQILLLAVWLDSCSACASAAMFGMNRPGRTGIATGVALIMGVVALFVLTPAYGIEGAAWASVVSYGLGALVNVGLLLQARRHLVAS